MHLANVLHHPVYVLCFSGIHMFVQLITAVPLNWNRLVLFSSGLDR
jgi:hypothetical protein